MTYFPSSVRSIRFGLALGLMLTVCGCGSLPIGNRAPNGPPSDFHLSRGPLRIQSDVYIAPDNRLIQALGEEREHLRLWFGLPVGDRPIQVYLFRDGYSFERYVAEHHPECPSRRAFFIDNGETLTVYAQWGPRGAEDLRHETAHAYIHSVAPDIPLWLDEGLAEYYEVPPHKRGVHEENLALLMAGYRNGSWRPNLRRLGALPSNYALGQVEYAECWAWVHFLMETRSAYRRVMREYMADLCADPRTPPLDLRMRGVTRTADAELIEFLERLESKASNGE